MSLYRNLTGAVCNESSGLLADANKSWTEAFQACNCTTWHNDIKDVCFLCKVRFLVDSEVSEMASRHGHRYTYAT